MANRHRPRRGPAGSNVLVTGDTGTTAGAQGGAKPGASESGDLDSREFGVPQADIPGGLRHVVNPESKPAKTAEKQLRPADEHKYHGVPPIDFGPYEDVPGTEHDKPLKASPEPKINEAVPVVIVEQGSRGRVCRRFLSEGPLTVPVTFPQTATGIEPLRLLNRDLKRSKVYITNEGSTGIMRIGSFADCQDGRGMKLTNNSEVTIEAQDDLWICNTGLASGIMSWGWETEVEVGGS